MNINRLFFLLIGLSALPVWADWPAALVDPQPADDAATELHLPLPCGGAMVFRRIDVTPAQGWLDDERVVLGAVDSRYGYKEYRREQAIAGAFSLPKEDRLERFYYLGKYEVTALQYAALNDPCPEPDRQGRLPATGVTWFDANDFIRRYNEWLYTAARDRLPVEDGMPGYVRLPTEAEWEYAVRGGLRVEDSERQAVVFPLAGGVLADYVWYGGSESADGRVRPVGLLRPNPLGLYDMLGNVAEIVLEPFRLAGYNQVHGQAGGFLVKGGDIHTPAEDIRSALREEHAPFDARSGQPNRLPYVGLRLAVAAPVLTSAARVQAIRAEWEGRTQPDLMRPPTLAALDDLERLLASAAAAPWREQLATIHQQIGSELARQDAERSRALRFLLRQAALTALRVVDVQSRLTVLQEQFAQVERSQQDIETLYASLSAAQQQAESEKQAQNRRHYKEAAVRLERNLAALQRQQQGNLTLYVDTLDLLTADYAEEDLRREAGALQKILTEQQAGFLLPFVEQCLTHVRRYRQDGAATPEVWREAIVRVGKP